METIGTTEDGQHVELHGLSVLSCYSLLRSPKSP